MQMMAVITIIFGILVVSVPGPADAGTFLTDTSTTRCPGGVVAVGDDAYDVLQTCGDPFRTYMQEGNEIWVYNFGQSRFVYYFQVFRDKLTRIQSRRCDLDNRDCIYIGR